MERLIFTKTETQNQAMTQNMEQSLDLWFKWNDPFYHTPPCWARLEDLSASEQVKST